jgi:hypothetical protein
VSAVQAPLQRDADLREQNERLKASLDRAAIDVANLQTELTAALRQNTLLERQIAKVNDKAVPATDVDEVFDHFLALVWSGKGRKPKLDDAKRKLIRGRLKDDFSVAELKQAIAGLARRPNVGDKGRCGPEQGKRFANLRHCLADADTVDRFIGYLDAPETPTYVVPIRRERRDPKTAQELADHIEFACGLDVRDLGHGRYMAQCPAHEDRDPSLSFKECDDGRILVNCFAGCPTEAVMDSIGWKMGHLRGRS